MNILKTRTKIFIIVIPIISYCILLWGHDEVSKLIDNLAIQILAILVGLIIGAVGVLIALLGNLFNDLLSSFEKKERSEQEEFKHNLRKWVDDCNETIAEIKKDIIFLIVALLSDSTISLIKQVDIPGCSWPINSQFISPEIILNLISLTMLGYSFLAIIDVVNTMFIIYDHNEVILEDKLDLENPGKNREKNGNN